MPSQTRPTRLLALLAIGPLFLVILGVEAWLNYKWSNSGIAGFLADSFKAPTVRAFSIRYAARIILPIYLVGGLAAWFATWTPSLLLDRDWSSSWRGREALGLGLSALLWIHLLYWWQVPTTLWVLPGLRRLPFWTIFILLLGAALAYPLTWLWRRRARRAGVRFAMLGLWLLLWTALAMAPTRLPRPLPESRGGDQPCKVLMLGIDGLRSDTFLQEGRELKGIKYENAYTPIPATRLLWHILWGGDPLFYTVGHVGPSIEEYQHPESLVLLHQARLAGWRPRFYIDDGGTIGIAERVMDFDDALMPAEGWENYVNSNLASSFPLYAAWENWFKPFPTTNPWSSLDSGLKEALRLGRGSGWVMFHTCHAHQPIFLKREELAQTGRWWTLKPSAYEPTAAIQEVSLNMGLHPEPRTNPFLAYTIRMRSILNAWQPIWNALGQDPQYKDAVRVLFSDHGERFHNVGPAGFQLQGVHGYNLDPWECRSAMLISGPGFSDRIEPNPRLATTSLLGLRDGVERMLQGSGPFDSAFFEASYPEAPIRYHTLSHPTLPNEPGKYLEMDLKEMISGNYIANHGVWLTVYSKPASVRASEVSLGFAKGDTLDIYKPLVGGGAHLFRYQGYDALGYAKVDEAEYTAKKQEAIDLLKPLKPMVENAKAN